jgi:pimeloyl-ACP methyl ester carboxylesterase
MRKVATETAKMFTEKGMVEAAAIYGDGQMRQAHKNKDPRGYAEFMQMLSEHSAEGHSHTMAQLQAKRPTLWDLEPSLKKLSVPLLIVSGDEDEPCLDGSVFLKRMAPTAGLLVIPRSGHNVNTEEPAAFNAALAELFAAAEAGRWLAHKPSA